jgi:transposase-like protein
MPVGCIFGFPHGVRLVEEMLLERGIAASCEIVRHWGIRFGADFWHLDKVAIAMDGGKFVPARPAELMARMFRTA